MLSADLAHPRQRAKFRTRLIVFTTCVHQQLDPISDPPSLQRKNFAPGASNLFSTGGFKVRGASHLAPHHYRELEGRLCARRAFIASSIHMARLMSPTIRKRKRSSINSGLQKRRKDGSPPNRPQIVAGESLFYATNARPEYETGRGQQRESRQATADNGEKEEIIIAIDFGTNNSVVALHRRQVQVRWS